MTEPLGHAEAHERLSDLALERGGLDRLGDPGHESLAAHVAGCDRCRREIEAWRRTEAALAAARGPVEDVATLADLAVDAPIAAPASVRAAVAALPGHLRPDAPTLEGERGNAGPGAEPAPSRRRDALRAGRRWLALVAVLVIAVGAGAVVVDQALRLGEADREAAALEAATAAIDRILQAPDHRVVELIGADGRSQGTLSWSSHDLVVLTTALERPPAEAGYRCWIERDGHRSPVGLMWFAGDTAFWNGSLDEWATTSLEGGGTFGVSLEPTTGPVGNPAVLAADLGG